MPLRARQEPDPAEAAQLRERAVQKAHPLQPQLRHRVDMGEKSLGLRKDLVVHPQPPLHVAGEPRKGEQRDEIHSQQNVREGGVFAHQGARLLLAEGDVPLLLPGGTLQETDDGRLVDGVDEGLKHHQHHALADRHFRAHVLGEVSAHAPRGEPPHHRVGGPRLGSQQCVQPEKDADVGQLLHGLAREEGRRLERRRRVEPVAALDAGDFAVEELVKNPSQELSIPGKTEAGAVKVEAESVPWDEHRVRIGVHDAV